MSQRSSHKWMSRVAVILAAATLAVGGVGFLHTPLGRKLPIARKLLSWMGMSCPLEDAHLTAAQVEQSRLLGARALRGEARAPARPVLTGLKLDETTEVQASRWADSHGIACKSQVRGMRFLRCEDVAPSALGEVPGAPPIHAVTLAFNSHDRLVAVDLFRRQLGAKEAARLMLELSHRLRSTLGKPTEAKGELTPGQLGGDTVKTAFVNYRFRDYLAMLTATNIPWSGGIAVHEQYSSTR